MCFLLILGSWIMLCGIAPDRQRGLAQRFLHFSPTFPLTSLKFRELVQYIGHDTFYFIIPRDMLYLWRLEMYIA